MTDLRSYSKHLLTDRGWSCARDAVASKSVTGIMINHLWNIAVLDGDV